jgi:SAM-dependent methyltransferase
VGSGTGRVTSHLAACGLRTVGIDLSPGMAAVARKTHPDLAYAVGDVCALPVRSGSLGGLVAWYSMIHLRSDQLPAACAELARVTRPGAPVLVGFQSGHGQRVDKKTSYGNPVRLTYYRHPVDLVARLLDRAGLALHATVQREVTLDFETTPQGFLLAHRRSDAGDREGVAG